MGMDSVPDQSGSGLGKTNAGMEEKKVVEQHDEYGELLKAGDAVMQMQSYFLRKFPGGIMSRKIEAIVNVLNTKTVFSYEVLDTVKDDFEKLKDIYLESLAEQGLKDSALEDAFNKIREELEKVKVVKY